MSSFCLGCGNGLAEGERFCTVCGKDSTISAAPRIDPGIAFGLAPETSGKAIFSLVCGFLSVFFPFAFGAVIFGHLSLSEIRRSAGRLTGRALAITGIIFGYLGVAFLLFLIGLGIYASQKDWKQQQANRVHRTAPSPYKNAPTALLNDNSAVSAVRSLNMAEIAYAQQHHAEGYSCSLPDLKSAWGLGNDLARGKSNGYIFELRNCTATETNGPITKYQLVAYPAAGAKAFAGGKTSNPAYCSDQSDVIRFAKNGSAQDCLKNGADLAENEINHPRSGPQHPAGDTPQIPQSQTSR